ncbi:MAG: tyrosine-type recombinase/integrase [Sphingobacteriales bacterium]|nr:tyrosine-type recombinase/integrase [Sphingobacteriales bacterium]OJV98489.1 MAG: integrase [Sphingobacteriales bacterium 44-61]
MLLPIKAICDRRAKKDGTSAINIQYCYSSEKRTVLPTGINIPSAYWNKKLQVVAVKMPVSFGNAEELNEKLRLLLRRTEDLVLLSRKYEADCIATLKDYFISPRSIEEVEALLKKRQDNTNAVYTNLDFFFQVDDYIRSQTTKVSEHMPAIYRNMKMHLQEFEKFWKSPITFDCLNYTFYEDLVEYLSYYYVHKRRNTKIKGLKKNTVGKTIKQLRIFLHNRARKSIIETIDLSGWTVFNEDADAIYLTWGEISKMYSVDLSEHPYLIPYQRDFVLGCLTGLRFSDFSGIEKTDITPHTIRIKQQKSNGWVVIPLRDEAKEILAQRFRNHQATLTNAEFNRHIKTIAKLAGITALIKHSYRKGNKKVVEVKPKYAWVTSHTCRRSFCTNEFLAGTPVELIMKISGHKSVKDFYRYIRITPEEAARILADIWKERGEMNVLESKFRKVS